MSGRGGTSSETLIIIVLPGGQIIKADASPSSAGAEALWKSAKAIVDSRLPQAGAVTALRYNEVTVSDSVQIISNDSPEQRAEKADDVYMTTIPVPAVDPIGFAAILRNDINADAQTFSSSAGLIKGQQQKTPYEYANMLLDTEHDSVTIANSLLAVRSEEDWAQLWQCVLDIVAAMAQIAVDQSDIKASLVLVAFAYPQGEKPGDPDCK